MLLMSYCNIREFNDRCPILGVHSPLVGSFTSDPIFSAEARAASKLPWKCVFCIRVVYVFPTGVMT